ncbi:hypothetical protein [Actinokineospora fastidiosa]|uniref:Uncharacterized protein n=1 Tax=Actinokineospora fastidiosa TaxID=1816 RepID=A0A918GUB1_9PSEU|nr:hypothetical protein [Actinokineospora fastidiosa]GGS61329.1 hypothetical protein GCM10010171_65150 [Actinokineospora fastidiosa]
MTGPNDFLTAMAGSTAGMVAIVGGFLVSRFVGMESEQQTLRRLVGDATARVELARAREEEARESHYRKEADELFNDHAVLEKIIRGESDLAELIRVANIYVDAPDDYLATVLASVKSEAGAALEKIRPYAQDSAKTLNQLRDESDWESFRVARLKDVTIRREAAWEVVHKLLYKVAIAKKKRAASRSGGFGFVDPIDIAISGIEPAWIVARRARLRDERIGELQRAGQHLADLEEERRRYVNQYYALGRPKAVLYSGLVVLLYYSIVGLALPIYYLSVGPDVFTPAVKSLLWWFLSGLAAFAIYLIIVARRVTRVRNLNL